MPKAFNESERQRIREKLIAAGRVLINTVGIRRFVVDDAARHAGISKGSFYSFFPSREDFILTVLESWETEYRGELIRRVSEGKGTPRQKVERFLLGAFDIMEREPGLARVGLQEIQSLVDRLPLDRLQAHKAADESVLEEAFRSWVKDGLLVTGLLDAFRGLIPALFSIAIHREDFPPGSFRPAVTLIAEALAMRMTAGSRRGGGDT